MLAARAFVYGLARMAIDGHFPEWHPSEPPSLAARRALHLFMSRMTNSKTHPHEHPEVASGDR
jgi:hypothetical protein